MKEIELRILTVMSIVFEIDLNKIPSDATPGKIEQWDSLKHMNLILAIEEEFNFRFTDDEMTDLLNLKLITTIVSEKLSTKQ